MSERSLPVITASKVLLLLAVIVAVLAAFHVSAPVELGWIAVALGFSSFLVP
jgi:hypothetical protein